MAQDKKSVAVLGAGAVGSILAASFKAAGESVILIESAPPRFEQVQRAGLQVRVAGDGPITTVKPDFLLRSIEELRGHEPEAIFICTKTWALKQVLPALHQVLSPHTLVICFQNGIGLEEEAQQIFPAERVARGIANYAGGVDENGQVTRVWFNPPNYLGPVATATTPRLEALAAALSRASLDTRSIPIHDIKKQVFLKSILNSALSALCATSNITMSQALSYRPTRALAERLVREGLAVAAAVGYTYGDNAFETCMKYLGEGGDHYPSMWTDLQRGSPTEIEVINGMIVEIGRMFENVSVEANRFLTAMVITQEIKSGARKPDDVPDYLKHF
jgi:2-dehydropantoate 2-reductase